MTSVQLTDGGPPLAPESTDRIARPLAPGRPVQSAVVPETPYGYSLEALNM